jgi:hypothetical protein
MVGAPETADAGTVDLASDFLSTACRERPGVAFAEAWLAHEDRHREIYDAFYYDSPESRSERRRLATALGPRRDEMCSNVRSFLVAAPGTIDALRGRVADLLGARPRAQVYFAVALQWTDGRAATFHGRDVLVLNARHDTFARTSGLVANLAHELIHNAQAIANDGRIADLPPLARSLYTEGAAVFGVQALFPELGATRALSFRPEQLERAEMVAPQAAAEVLRLLGAGVAFSSPEFGRFFRGGYVDDSYPPRMGYYLGARIFQIVAEKDGTRAAVRMGPTTFREQAQSILSSISRESPATHAHW